MFSTGDRIGKYEIIRRVGGGSFGDVYEALVAVLNARRAVKIIESDGSIEIDNFLTEAKLLHTCQAPNIVTVFDAGIVDYKSDDYAAIEMEFMEHGSITKWAEGNGLSVHKVLEAIRCVLRALSAAHGKGVIHRDVKPDNILVSQNDFKLGDFGISYIISESDDSDLPNYIAHTPPECLDGNNFNELADTYATGLTLFRLCLPSDQSDIFQHVPDWKNSGLKKTFPEFIGYPNYLPQRLRSVIQKATAIDPQDRYQSAGEMLTAIERLSVNIPWNLYRPHDEYRFTAVKSNRTHTLSFVEKNGKTACCYKVQNRKPREWQLEFGTRSDAAKKMYHKVKSTMLT